MYRLQLFQGDDALNPIDARFLGDGALSIGRDPSTDWTVIDPDCALSRVHCRLAADKDALLLTPIGANGVFDDSSGERFRDGEETALPVPCTLRLGNFRLVAAAAPGQGTAGGDKTMVLLAPIGASTEIPRDWADASRIEETFTESLLEAFCQGAGFDSSALSGEDPVAIMRRAGALYRQMVLGVSDLMQERDHARSGYQINRTTIGGSGNNYFKWAPSQRLAVDLLLSDKAAFLAGPEAVRSSFGDIKRHLIATIAGLRGSLREAIDAFSAKELTAAVADRQALLKGRAALQMEEVERRRAAFAAELDEGGRGALESAFVRAYDRADRNTR